MAHTARSHDDIPRPPMARPGIGLLGWAIFALLLAAGVAFGFLRARGPALHPVTVMAEKGPGAIRTWSSLALLSAGNTGATVPLSDLPSGPGVIGVGSLSGLRGEVAIVRGVVWVAYAQPDGKTRSERYAGSGEAATFLALADVPTSQAQTFESAIPFDRLARELEQRAARAGLDPGAPFPVLIDGRFSDIQLNVVNGPALGKSQPTDERVAQTALRTSLPQGEGSIVGFFATHDGERFIHPGERVHLHVVLPATGHVGHLDRATIEAGSVLWLPAVPMAPVGSKPARDGMPR
jgi:hypothetical protein